MALRSVMRHQFSQVPHAQIPRSSFDRSHGYKTTFDAGYLVPIYVDEALPGDTFSMSCTTFARLSTPLHPVMDNMFADIFFFFVPNRLVWTHWVNFMGQQDTPGASTSFLVPQSIANVSPYPAHSLQDYMGIPTNSGNVVFNTLHTRAYNLIWNEWFRDQNLTQAAVVDKGDGPDDQGNYVLRRRGKRHDYFTSALPWPQKDNGNPVTVPLGQSAPIRVPGGVNSTVPSVVTGNLGQVGAPRFRMQADSPAPAYVRLVPPIGGEIDMVADLTAATAATINQLRQAFQIQRVYERDARGGTRYTELILAHFGVSSPDARLQRPEYLGGGSCPVNVHPIAQTSATIAAQTPQGNLAAFGTVSHSGVGFTKSFTEHGVLIGLISVRADLTYQQGLNRMWSRQTRFDYYWPALAQIGEQSILGKEITFGLGIENVVFGYQERYAEYRYKPSIVTGQFRSSYPQTLDSWHLSQNFTTAPALNNTFIEENPPISRIVAVTTQPQFLLDCYFRLHCARPMPVYGVPGLIDHF